MDPRYRYRATLSLTILGDGQHSDGDGATATLRRIRRLVEADQRVAEVRVGGPFFMDSLPVVEAVELAPGDVMETAGEAKRG